MSKEGKGRTLTVWRGTRRGALRDVLHRLEEMSALLTAAVAGTGQGYPTKYPGPSSCHPEECHDGTFWLDDLATWV